MKVIQRDPIRECRSLAMLAWAAHMGVEARRSGHGVVLRPLSALASVGKEAAPMGGLTVTDSTPATAATVTPDGLRKPLHRVEWMVEKESITGKVICDAKPGDWCRLVCTEGCEAFDFLDHDHPFFDQGDCNVELWLNADCPTLTYVGPPRPAVNALIKPIWVGDYYEWKYADGA